MPERHSSRPFPPYAFVPGIHPHPRRDRAGYAYGQPEVPPPMLTPEHWRDHEEYLYGVDLYNHGYWWACHEALEGIWHVVGHATLTGQYLQGVIQVAAGNLKRFMKVEEGAQRLWAEGLGRLASIPDGHCGADVRGFERDARAYAAGTVPHPAPLMLRSSP